jgi:hypothetical protein
MFIVAVNTQWLSLLVLGVSGPLSDKMFTFVEVLLCEFFLFVILFIAYLHV